MKLIDGGVTAPKGFLAGGMYCGVRKNQTKLDLMMLKSEVRCTAAGVFTKNLVQGAPIAVCRAHLEDGMAQAVVANSGNANTCNADGLEKANAMAEAAAKALGVSAADVLVASTGVIGQPLPLEPIVTGIPKLAGAITGDAAGSLCAAKALMTTDTVEKNMAVELELAGKTVRIGGIAKGSGMIHPNMCTMLAFLTTDAAVSAKALDSALRLAAGDSFNMISVDGDMSTNDTCCILASGLAGNAPLTEGTPEFEAFTAALKALCTALCKAMAKDGEGATKLLVCHVAGAKDEDAAKVVSKAIICSSLVKTAMFGADANWGRVLCAIGYCGIETDIHAVDLSFCSKAGEIAVCKDGAGLDFDEVLAKKILLEDEITLEVTLRDGKAEATAYGCDLTYDYVKINGDYRT